VTGVNRHLGLLVVIAALGCGETPPSALPGPPPAADTAVSSADTAVPPADTAVPVDSQTPDVPLVDAPAPSPDTPPSPDAGVDDTGVADTGPAPAPAVFDMAMISKADTAECTFTKPRTVLKDLVSVKVWDVSYVSWESIDGALKPITIRGYAARPAQGGDNLPGVVGAHGLGGAAKESHATGLAALLNTVVIAYTGPGGGTEPANTSEGLASGHDNGYRMFDTLADPRGSWFWGHAVAGMRGITCLTTRADVDPARLGMTGFSAGGVASLISAGVDPRLKAIVALSASGAWDVATEAPQAWQHNLLTIAGLSTASPEWTTLLAAVDSKNLLPMGPAAAVMMVNGTSDEFFPLTAHLATLDAVVQDKRTSLIGNFDHGCYLVSGGESAKTIEARADLRAKGAQRAWFHHHFGTDSAYVTVPAPPTFTAESVGLATAVSATVDPGGPGLKIEHVKVWWSNDKAFLWGSVELKSQGNQGWFELALFPKTADTILFVDVQYSTTDKLLKEQFSISSAPQIPAGLVPHIRNIQSCL